MVGAPMDIRGAIPADIPMLEALIARSARGLALGDYTARQIEAALGTAFGVDSELIGDGTYFVVEVGGAPAACGGWSRRATMFGADGQPGRTSTLLSPATDAARIRAFFVDPAFARRGIGRALLAHCEAAARAEGFRAATLMATLPGIRLYAAAGYAPIERVVHPLPGGETIEFVSMQRAL